MLKLVKLDLLDVLSTSTTTVSGVFTVSLNKDFNVCKSVYVPAFARHAHRSKTPTNSFYFYTYISVKMATIVGAINRFIPSGYVRPPCQLSLGSKFTGLDLDLETSGLGLGLGLVNVVLDHLNEWDAKPLQLYYYHYYCVD